MIHAGTTTPKNLGSVRISTALTALALLLLPAATTQAQPATEVELELVLSGMSNTVDLQSAGDSRLFAVGRNGVIELITFDNQGVASLDPMPFLDINGLVYSAGGEQGLLGLAFHPEYDANGYFFVNYSCDASEQADCASDGDTIIARYTVSADPDVADPSSAFVVATQSQPGTNHNGGQLQFEPMPDPTDGRTILYIGMGDGGSNGTAQDLSSLLGKMLRVDIDDMDDIPPLPPLPRYFVPTDNPTIDGVKDEIWAYGLRNPWRNSFDRLTGDFFIADVGQNNREEVNFQAAASPGGENYGWRQCEGTRVNVAAEAPDGCTGGGGLTPPILEYDHNNGCSITGGYIYRGVEFASELGGTYFYADYCTGELWGARPDGGGGWSNTIDEDTGLRFTIASFGEDNVGELYLTTIAGNLYRIRPIATDQPDLIVTAVDGPTEGNIGETIVVTPTEIENQGVGAAGATEVGYYFTTDPDNVPNQTFSTSVCPIPALGSGESYTCLDITVNVPGSLAAGPHSLVAIVDDQDNVGESDETNNDLADLQQILLSCIDGGNACISDAQCCSNKCRGGGGNKTCKGGSTSCTPSEDPEISCSDGQDNDCDGLTDTSDPDCGGGSCEPKGDFCTVDSQCCSNKCRGPSGNKSCK
jgi:glucose/arabinose dehydrogenase